MKTALSNKNSFFKSVAVTVMTLCFMFISAVPVSAEISVIVNPASGVSSADVKAIKKIFLGKSTSLSGVDVTAADQDEGSAVRDEFYMKVTKKNATKLKNYWSKMIFSGKAIPAEVVGDDAAVVSWVASKKNGIGYVDSSAVTGSVKVIFKVQ